MEERDYIVLKENRHDDAKDALMEKKIYYSANYLWCPCCKRRSSYDMAMENGSNWLKENGYEVEQDSYWADSVLKCNSCGHVFKVNAKNNLENIDIASYEKSHLATDTYPVKNGQNRIYENVGYDKKKKKLSIMASFMQLIPGETLIPEIFIRKLILHLDTGKAFYVTDKRPDRRKCFGSHAKSTIVNISNTHYASMWYFSNELAEFFLEKYLEFKNVDRSDYEIFANSGYKGGYGNEDAFLFCIQHNCHPNLVYSYDSYSGRKDILLERNYHNMHELYRYYPKDLIDTETVFQNAVKGLRVPSSKKFMKEYRADILKIQYAYRLKKMGFKDINLIYALMQTELPVSYDELQEKVLFTKKLIATNGEKNACRKILAVISAQWWIFKDAARSYARIMNHDETLIPPKVFCNNLKDIHDILSKISVKIQYANKEITYNNTERQLEASINSISFVLAQDTNELIRIGSDMHICVGDYRDSALNKSCTIISMKKDNQYVGCLELNKNSLIQAKSFANKMLCNEEADALEEWVSQKRILTYGCYDYENLRRESNGYNRDYHQLELDDDGYVVRREALPF